MVPPPSGRVPQVWGRLGRRLQAVRSEGKGSEEGPHSAERGVPPVPPPPRPRRRLGKWASLPKPRSVELAGSGVQARGLPLPSSPFPDQNHDQLCPQASSWTLWGDGKPGASGGSSGSMGGRGASPGGPGPPPPGKPDPGPGQTLSGLVNLPRSPPAKCFYSGIIRRLIITSCTVSGWRSILFEPESVCNRFECQPPAPSFERHPVLDCL